MKSLVDILAIIVAVAGFVGFLYEFYVFETAEGGGYTHLWISLASVAIGIAGALVYFLRHVNKEEEIHITQ